MSELSISQQINNLPIPKEIRFFLKKHDKTNMIYFKIFNYSNNIIIRINFNSVKKGFIFTKNIEKLFLKTKKNFNISSHHEGSLSTIEIII